MEHQTTITTTTAALDQENNQLLLNAIKNKFAAQTAHEAASFSPPKFNIPTLKTQDGNGFVLPQLQFGKDQKQSSHFEIPLLKNATPINSGVSSLTTAIDKLKVEENEKKLTTSPILSTTVPAIDLSSALAAKSAIHQPTAPTRDFSAKVKQENSDFDIPFIDCDRLDNATTKWKRDPFITKNEYCLIDISQEIIKPCSYKAEPSPVGKFLYLVDKRYTTVPLKCMTSAGQYKLKVKHVVQPFQFDTKSPDDKVLQSLNKYGRR